VGRGVSREIDVPWRVAAHLPKLTMAHPSIAIVLRGTNGTNSRAWRGTSEAQESPPVRPKRHPIPYIVHYF
jgi:hypothetical protein